MFALDVIPHDVVEIANVTEIVCMLALAHNRCANVTPECSISCVCDRNSSRLQPSDLNLEHRISGDAPTTGEKTGEAQADDQPKPRKEVTHDDLQNDVFIDVLMKTHEQVLWGPPGGVLRYDAFRVEWRHGYLIRLHSSLNRGYVSLRHPAPASCTYNRRKLLLVSSGCT